MSFLQYTITIVFVVGSIHCLPTNTKDEQLLSLSVVHINDFHARFEETNEDGSPCTEIGACVGGFSRLYEQITSILDNSENPVLLNAGDNFQGTFYYTVGKWNITQEFLNTLPFDALVPGSHEFDEKIAGFVEFSEALKFPILASNIDDSLVPEIQGKYQKSTVIERGGKKIGIVGVIYSTVDETLNTGDLAFLPESASVNAEAERLVAEEGVFTNIVLSHSGYDVDQLIAANATESIGLIIGGHSHAFLYTGDNPPGPEHAEGPYPTIVTSSVSGRQILITQASAFSRYVGNITVFYGENGEVLDYAGAPIYLDETYPRDEGIDEALAPWSQLVDEVGNEVLGSTVDLLEGSDYVCRVRECTIGNFIADAMVFEYADFAKIAITYSDGIEAGIEPGDITMNQLVTAQPFENTIDLLELKGQHLWEVFEYSTNPSWPGWADKYYLKLLQVAGLQVVLDISKPVGERVDSVKVLCQDCEDPEYVDVDLEETYSVVMPSFLRLGGDGFTFLKDYAQNVQEGRLDTDVYVDYLAANSPVSEKIEGRLVVYGQEKPWGRANVK